MSIATVYAEGRLIRKDYSRIEAGRQLLCGLTALTGDPETRPETCPAELCPPWLAYLVPFIFDRGSESCWPSVVERLIGVESWLGRLRPRVEWQVRALCAREAMRHTTDTADLAFCERVAVLCERRGRGEVVLDSECEAVSQSATWVAAAVWAAVAVEWAAVAVAVVVWAEVAAADRIIDGILDAIEADLREQGVIAGGGTGAVCPGR